MEDKARFRPKGGDKLPTACQAKTEFYTKGPWYYT